jgi:hypothetical protein
VLADIEMFAEVSGFPLTEEPTADFAVEPVWSDRLILINMEKGVGAIDMDLPLENSVMAVIVSGKKGKSSEGFWFRNEFSTMGDPWRCSGEGFGEAMAWGNGFARQNRRRSPLHKRSL